MSAPVTGTGEAARTPVFNPTAPLQFPSPLPSWPLAFDTNLGAPTPPPDHSMFYPPAQAPALGLLPRMPAPTPLSDFGFDPNTMSAPSPNDALPPYGFWPPLGPSSPALPQMNYYGQSTPNTRHLAQTQAQAQTQAHAKQRTTSALHRPAPTGHYNFAAPTKAARSGEVHQLRSNVEVPRITAMADVGATAPGQIQPATQAQRQTQAQAQIHVVAASRGGEERGGSTTGSNVPRRKVRGEVWGEAPDGVGRADNNGISGPEWQLEDENEPAPKPEPEAQTRTTQQNEMVPTIVSRVLVGNHSKFSTGMPQAMRPSLHFGPGKPMGMPFPMGPSGPMMMHFMGPGGLMWTPPMGPMGPPPFIWMPMATPMGANGANKTMSQQPPPPSGPQARPAISAMVPGSRGVQPQGPGSTSQPWKGQNYDDIVKKCRGSGKLFEDQEVLKHTSILSQIMYLTYTVFYI